MKRLFIAAIVAFGLSSAALAQTQPIPTAIAPGGQTMNSTPTAIMVAPAGGGGGKGTVVSPDHPLPVTMGAAPLPAGGATAAKQDTGNASLGSIDGKLPAALGQTTKSASVSVTMASDQAQASSTDISGTVTTGGAYQTVAALNTARKGCLVQNPTTATEGLNVRQGGATVWTLNPGGTFTCNASGVIVTDLIEVSAATTGHAFAAAKQ